MNIGIKIARFIAWVGAYERSFVIRTDFDYRKLWRCLSCGNLHNDGYAWYAHRNPYSTKCAMCGTGHLIFIGGRKPN